MNIDNIALSRGEKWRRTVLGIHVLFANSSASWRWTFCEHCDLPAGSMLGLINRGRWRDTGLERGCSILVLLLSLCFSRGRRPGDTRWHSPPGTWHFTMGCLPQHLRCAHFGKFLHYLVGQSSNIVNPIWISALSCFLD